MRIKGKRKMEHKKIIIPIISMILLFLIIANVRAEITLFTTTSLDTNNSLVKNQGYYYFDDTSLIGIGRNKDIPITLVYQVYELPFNFSGIYPVEVDWCNLTILHYKNKYDKEGNIENTTEERFNLFFQNQPSSSSSLTYNLRSRDYLIARMNCHYTDVNYLFVENALVGSISNILMPSYECDKCEEFTLEELSNQIERNEEISANELEIYENIQTLIDWNFTIWLIISYIIKIGFVLIAVGLIFMGVYYLYTFFKNISEHI